MTNELGHQLMSRNNLVLSEYNAVDFKKEEKPCPSIPNTITREAGTTITGAVQDPVRLVRPALRAHILPVHVLRFRPVPPSRLRDLRADNLETQNNSIALSALRIFTEGFDF